MYSVKIWLNNNPPMIATPSGRRNSEPGPLLIARGTAPSSAAAVVIMIGRKRSRQALKIASRGGNFSSRSASSAKSIIMIAFFFTIPISSTIPIIPMIDKSKPNNRSASSAPIPAEGSVEIIVNG